MKSRFRFDLFAILEWMVGVALVYAMFASSGGRASWTYDFAALPEEDTTLNAWLETQGSKNVRVTREGNSVTLFTQFGVFSRSIFTGGVVNPPWDELGYQGLRDKQGSMQWKMFSGSPYLWAAGFLILIALGPIRRWYIKKQH